MCVNITIMYNVCCFSLLACYVLYPKLTMDPGQANGYGSSNAFVFCKICCISRMKKKKTLTQIQASLIASKHSTGQGIIQDFFKTALSPINFIFQAERVFRLLVGPREICKIDRQL